MKKLLLISLAIFSLAFTRGGYTYKEIMYGDALVVTYDQHTGTIDWDKSGQRIAFESSFEGSKNIYFLKLFDLPINFARNGFHSAKYINNLDDKSRIYVPMAVAADTNFTEPKWDNNGRRLLCIGEHNGNTEVFVTNKRTLVCKGTGIKNIETANWKNDTLLYIVTKKEQNKLYTISLKTKKKQLLFESQHKITGISKQRLAIYLTCENGVIELNPKTNEGTWYQLPIKGKSTSRLGRLNFLALNKDGSASVLDLNNAISHPFLAGNMDGAPALSGDEKFVAFYSEFVNGIVIKRINKEFFLE